MSSILWIYQTQGLIIIGDPGTEVTWYSSQGEKPSADHKKYLRLFILKLLGFNLVKVQRSLLNLIRFMDWSYSLLALSYKKFSYRFSGEL